MYRGRLAPSPTGLLHLGHARTFQVAQERARAAGGALALRVEDLDPERCRPEFVEAMFEDLRWFGLEWDGEPFFQSERRQLYREAWGRLREMGAIYPCDCSRTDVLSAIGAPHAGDEEPLYPGTCRGRVPTGEGPEGVTWRFRVPDGEEMAFDDGIHGRRTAIAGRDFGDFVVWRRDDLPAYQLAVVVDDAAMGITEVVRGEDLLLSTFRQMLLYRALELPIPQFCHCRLVRDAHGRRLAKRDAAMSLRSLRASGWSAEALRTGNQLVAQ